MKKLLSIALLFLMFVYSSPMGAWGWDLNQEKERLTSESVHFTFGLGWAANEFLGGVSKDGLGYAKSSFGLNTLLGYSHTWIYGAPLKQEILNAMDEVISENGGTENLTPEKLMELTKKKLGNRSYTYFRLGTVYLVLPLVAQYGWMIPLGDVGRFQFGLGLPLLLNFGINFDF